MNINDLKRVLPALLKHKIVPYLHGAQGVGKTSTVRQYCIENNLKFIPLYLATQDQGDLVGLLDKDKKSGTVSHLPPEWMKEAQEGKGVVFLDELNRAVPEVLQVIFPFLQTGKIHRQGIGSEWRIVAAGNYQTNKFNTTDISDSALLSRFCHLDIKPEVTEFAAYAEDLGNETIAAFVRDNPKFMISGGDEGLDLTSIPFDPRAWIEKVGLLENEDLGNVEYEVIAGCVGNVAASAYLTYKKKNERPISALKVLNAYGTIRSNVLDLSRGTDSRFDLLNTAVNEIISRLEKTPHLLNDSRLENLKQFLLDIPLEMSMGAIKAFGSIRFVGRESLLNNPEYAKKMVNREKI